MLSKEQVQAMCKKVGLNENAIVLGKGSSCTRGRYKQRATNLGNDNIYVVQYCKDIDYYVAWDVSRKGVVKRETYSVMSKQLADISERKINSVSKNVEFAGKNSEVVLVFKPRLFGEFLEKYVKPRYRQA